MLKKIILIIFLLSVTKEYSQNYYFNKEIANDSVKEGDYFKDLGELLSNDYEYNFGVTDSIKKKIYFHFSKKDYIAGLESINDFRNNLSINGWDNHFYFLLEIFAKTNIRKDVYKIPFKDALDYTVKEFFNNVSSHTFIKLNNSFDKNEYNIKSFLDYTESLKNDSISFNTGFKLLEEYINYKVEKNIFSKVRDSYKVTHDAKFLIETKDILLKNDVLLTLTIVRNKKNKKKSPVILTNNIYAGENDTIIAKRAAINDYIGIVVNPRGKRNSTSDILPFENEAEDIYNVIDWICKQKWSNKEVGMIGGSYLGFSQWAATKKLHPGLKTIVPQVAVGIGAYDFPMNNNIFMSYMLQWISYVSSNKLTDRSDFYNFDKWENTFDIWFKSGKKFRDLDSINGGRNVIFQKWLNHPSHDEYWQKMIPQKEEFKHINIPVLTTTGYYDAEQRGALYYLKEHYKYNENANHYLVIGPYDHSTGQSYTRNILYGYELDSVAKINIYDLSFKWFDYILKGKEKPEILKEKINFQVMNTDKWMHVNRLEDTFNSKINFYLSNNNNNSESVFKKPLENKFTIQKVDFKNRDLKSKYFHSKNDSLLINENTLVFESEILDKDLIISGAFQGEMKVSINKKDFDFSIKLMQILPNGEFFNLSNFLGRASYLKDHSERNLLFPNELEVLPIENSMLISKKIEKKSKLIVLINVVFNKENQINYGTGKDVSDESILDADIPLEIKWFNDSFIEIPILNNNDEEKRK